MRAQRGRALCLFSFGGRCLGAGWWLSRWPEGGGASGPQSLSQVVVHPRPGRVRLLFSPLSGEPVFMHFAEEETSSGGLHCQCRLDLCCKQPLGTPQAHPDAQPGFRLLLLLSCPLQPSPVQRADHTTVQRPSDTAPSQVWGSGPGGLSPKRIAPHDGSCSPEHTKSLQSPSPGSIPWKPPPIPYWALLWASKALSASSLRCLRRSVRLLVLTLQDGSPK